MRTKLLPVMGLAVLLITAATMPAMAAPSAQVDECKNDDTEPDGSGPPGFVADLVPDFISNLVGSLPVPGFVKTFFGASTC